MREAEELRKRMDAELRENLARKREGWIKFCAARGVDPGSAFVLRDVFGA
jgi:hypothetical protein